MNTTYFGSAVRTRRLQQNWLILWSVGQKGNGDIAARFRVRRGAGVSETRTAFGIDKRRGRSAERGADRPGGHCYVW
jgi:hypothetical protein